MYTLASFLHVAFWQVYLCWCSCCNIHSGKSIYKKIEAWSFLHNIVEEDPYNEEFAELKGVIIPDENGR